LLGYALIVQEIKHDTISIPQKDKKIFRGFIRSGDFDSNPDLDFLIEAQEVSGSLYYYLNSFQSFFTVPFVFFLRGSEAILSRVPREFCLREGIGSPSGNS
jgi:hypothetical protein